MSTSTTITQPIVPTTSLTKQDLTKDLNLLTALSPSSLTSLKSLFRSSPISQPTPQSPQSATTILDTFSPSKASVEDSQRLIKAYISSMNSDVLGMDEGGKGLEEVGERIDVVRRRGGEIGEALEGVKV